MDARRRPGHCAMQTSTAGIDRRAGAGRTS